MKQTYIQSEYGFRARAQLSYNPDHDVPQSNKRKRRIVKSKSAKTKKSNKHIKPDFYHDCESSQDKYTVITLNTSKSNELQRVISFDSEESQSKQNCSNDQNSIQFPFQQTQHMDLFQSLLEDVNQILMF